jgi:DNA-directed RNA polymerase specialized sigma54-like protein
MKKRSLLELDTVIEEIIERNPQFEIELEKIIKESQNGRLRRRSRISRNQIHSTVEEVPSRTNANSRTRC